MSARAAARQHSPARAASQLDDLSHLYRRAGFGATTGEIKAAARRGMKATVAGLVDYDATPDPFDPPANIINARSRNPDNLIEWWVGRMLTTSRPLQEKMTLFWHGHFATAMQKVANPVLMFNQNQLLRENAMGRFDDMLSAVYKDPAMLIWLDGRRNTARAPNENYGREVMELFTIGHGKYTEDDVHANARAYTGWAVSPDGTARFAPRLHDDGVKTLLGQTGNWGAEDSVRILAAHPATGAFLARKLWHFFASDSPPSSVIKKMSDIYYTCDHSIREMVRTMFASTQFYSVETRTGHIKSPTEFVVTALKALELGETDLSAVPRVLAQLGQQLFDPPNVGGWPAGSTWINPTTMLVRFNFASLLAGDAPKGTGLLDTDALITRSKAKTMPELSAYISGLLGVKPQGATASALKKYAGSGSVKRADIAGRAAGLVHLTLVSPEYQVS